MAIKCIQQLMLSSCIKNERDAEKTLGKVKAAGFEGIELCSFLLSPPRPLVRLLTRAAGIPVGGRRLPWKRLIDSSGLLVTAIHRDLGSLETDLPAVLSEARAFKTQRIVISGMYRFDYSGAENVEALAKRLNRAGALLKREGLFLSYHNHNGELQKTEKGKNAYEILLEETEEALVDFEFDSYWFCEAGADPKVWMKRLEPRMKGWHITDRGPVKRGPAITPILKSDCRELGQGSMDLVEMAELAKACGIEAVILESHRNHEGNSPIRSLQRSALWLRQHF